MVLSKRARLFARADDGRAALAPTKTLQMRGEWPNESSSRPRSRTLSRALCHQTGLHLSLLSTLGIPEHGSGSTAPVLSGILLYGAVRTLCWSTGSRRISSADRGDLVLVL